MPGASSILGTAGTAVAAALAATGVAAAAGVDSLTWSSAWISGGRVRPWRPSQVQRGRAPYVEWTVGDADFGNNSYDEGGLATITIGVAVIVRTSDHGAAEANSAAILLTALDSIRGLGGGFAGRGDRTGPLVKVAGYSDVWRREAQIEVTLDYNFAQRAVDPGASSLPTTTQGFQITFPVNYTDVAGVSIALPAGYVVTSVNVTSTTAWNGTGAALNVYLDPDATPLITENAAALNELAIAREFQGAISGATAIRVVPTPGTGATTGQVSVTLKASAP